MDLTKIGACKICGDNLTIDHVCDKFAQIKRIQSMVDKWDNGACAECAVKDTTIKELVEALGKLARLGNEPHYGNSIGNQIAIDALAKHKKETPSE